MPFRCDVEERTGTAVLRLFGSLDIATALPWKPDVALLAERFASVAVDLAELVLIDSSGVGVLISLFKRVRERGGEVVFASVNGQPREIFRLLRLDRSLDLAAGVDEALAQLKAKA